MGAHINFTKNQHFCKLTRKIWLRTLTSQKICIFTYKIWQQYIKALLN